MTANIYWKPERNEGISLDGVMAPSSFMRECEKVFGGFPVVIGDSQLSEVRTLAALEDNDGPWAEVAKILSKHQTIRIFVED